MGHLIAAESVREAYDLDQILFIPASIPPHKVTSERTDARHRLAMTKLAIEGNDLFDVSEIELKREGTSYTIDTMEQLTNPDTKLSLIIGMDNLQIFHEWHRFEDILAIAKVVVLARTVGEGKVSRDLVDRVEIFPLPLIDISSSDIRSRVHEGKSIRYLVPEPVREYILREGLYK
jgi:nicotinate-nucleotide adenylyltransferase